MSRAEKPRVYAVMSEDAYIALFDEPRRARLQTLADFAGHRTNTDDLADAEVLITSWGAPLLDDSTLPRMPNLRAVFHAAGSVRAHVGEAVWHRGIVVTTAADANAVPVAEFTLASILLAGKRAFAHVHTPPHDGNNLRPAHTIGNLDRTVGIVGFSRIGARVAHLLRPFDGLRVLVADPYAEAEAVAAAGGQLVSLDELLPQVDVLSLHAPALPATRHMIGSAQLAALRDGATVINTARGSLIDHEALRVECEQGRLDAVLDVTDPEPLPATSPLRRLSNVTITPHLAGSLGTELRRLTDSALAELERFTEDLPPLHPVTRADLATMA